MRRKIMAVLAGLTMAVTVAGCASTTDIAMPLAPAAISSARGAGFALGEISGQVPEMPEHFLAALKGYLKVALAARGILAKNPTQDMANIEVAVVAYRVRSGPSRALWRALAGADTIESIVRVRRRDELLGEARVSSSNLTVSLGPDDMVRMHAEEIADFLRPPAPPPARRPLIEDVGARAK